MMIMISMNEKVYDGATVEAPEIGRFCSSGLPVPATLKSTSNQMYIRLKADNSHSARGFKAHYETVGSP